MIPSPPTSQNEKRGCGEGGGLERGVSFFVDLEFLGPGNLGTWISDHNSRPDLTRPWQAPPSPQVKVLGRGLVGYEFHLHTTEFEPATFLSSQGPTMGLGLVLICPGLSSRCLWDVIWNLGFGY
jgi:hypothetical protein